MLTFQARWLLSVLLLFSVPVVADELPRLSWGRLTVDTMRSGVLIAEATEPASRETLSLPTPFPQLVRVGEGSPVGWRPIRFEFNRDATQLHLIPSKSAPAPAAVQFTFESSDHSQQFPDGRIVFTAADATVRGTTAKLEQHPGNDRIGFWTNPEDTISWEFTATRPGMYRTWLTYSTASQDGSRIQIECDDGKTQGTLASTGSWYRYASLDLGPMYIAQAGRKSLTVRCTEKVGGAVMNLKAIVLDPACEGTPPIQAEDGIVTLHGRDATVHSILLQYERAEKKQTLGYWVRPEDWAVWTFTLKHPGTFDVEALQGCGTGQGGSTMLIRVGEQSLRFEVEDTGHFQNFKPRIVGRFEIPQPGEYTLSIRPERIALKAACDIRQLRLIPVR